ncbi:hypothetical protein DSM112329_03947 [Paraconexibacter sp. AEG42_29]|uniref:DUF4198 domain-containing protein n=1 Tax=Paraconexibacter sp. AEG42_29 TaxID=2997339 RepID=A0AAU7AZL2_9ACTN
MHRSLEARSLVALTTTAAIAAGAAIAVAQESAPAAPPVVAYTLGKLKSTPSGPATVPAGAVRFKVSTKVKGEHGFQVFRLADGADVAAAQKAVRSISNGTAFEKLKDITAVGGTEVSVAKPGEATFELTPGNYLFADFSDEKVNPTTPFVVPAAGATPPAALPAATATLSMFDYKFEVAGRLPRNGDLRIVNKGKRNHILVTFKAQNPAGAARLAKAFKASNEKAAGKEIRGNATGANIIGPGVTQDLAFDAKPGSYVFVCFYESKASKGKEHNVLGMVKTATVK